MPLVPWRALGLPILLAKTGSLTLPGVVFATTISQEITPSPAIWLIFASIIAFCLPLGIALIAAGGLPEQRAREATLSLLAALALGTLGYWAVGFGIQFGGVSLAYHNPGLEELSLAWSALPPSWGPGWAMVGLRGFGLMNGADTPAAYGLFLAFLPWAVTATLIPLLALRGRVPAAISLLVGLGTGSLLYPLIGNWVWGGGWLAELGLNLDLAHGFVDFAGASTVHLLGAAVALAGILITWPERSQEVQPAASPAEAVSLPVTTAAETALDNPSSVNRGSISGGSTDDATEEIPLPPVHLPLLATLGAVLVMVGSLGWALANPLVDWSHVPVSLTALNVLLAATGGAAFPLAYTWFVTSHPDPLMAARGLLAGAIAGCGAGPFIPPWAAILVGIVAGIIVPLAIYILQHRFGWDDRAAILSTSGIGGLLGGIATGFLADGRWGQGWNRIGEATYLSEAGQGVSGLFAASGLQSDWPGQMQAQIVGLATIALFVFVAAWILLTVTAIVARALSS